jgi:hypothetical protein
MAARISVKSYCVLLLVSYIMVVYNATAAWWVTEPDWVLTTNIKCCEYSPGNVNFKLCGGDKRSSLL